MFLHPHPVLVLKGFFVIFCALAMLAICCGRSLTNNSWHNQKPWYVLRISDIKIHQVPHRPQKTRGIHVTFSFPKETFLWRITVIKRHSKAHHKHITATSHLHQFFFDESFYLQVSVGVRQQIYQRRFQKSPFRVLLLARI